MHAMTTRYARLTAHSILLLTALRNTDAPSTEAALYHALFKAGMKVDEAASVLDTLLSCGLVERVGRVAVDITEDGIECVEAYEAKAAG